MTDDRPSVLYSLSSTTSGGCEKQMLFLAGKMVERGYRVTFAVPAVPDVDSLATELRGPASMWCASPDSEAGFRPIG